MSAFDARRCRVASFVLLFACSSATAAEKFTGVVTRVVDGDTLVVEYLQQHISVQLEGIDAPEAGEPYGRSATQSLAKLCNRQTARVESDRADAWGRVLGEVWCNGVNVNAAQLRRGMGRLETPQQAPREWRALQRDARKARRGLWRRK